MEEQRTDGQRIRLRIMERRGEEGRGESYELIKTGGNVHLQ